MNVANKVYVLGAHGRGHRCAGHRHRVAGRRGAGALNKERTVVVYLAALADLERIVVVVREAGGRSPDVLATGGRGGKSRDGLEVVGAAFAKEDRHWLCDS